MTGPDPRLGNPEWVDNSTDSSIALTHDHLADEWTLRRVELIDDLLVAIPNPAQVIVLDQAFGFHGPVNKALIESVA